MKTKISIFSIVMLLCTSSAFAGWQHNGYYVNDGSYNDDGSRFVLSLRGGLSMGNAKLKNEMGSLYAMYYINKKTNDIVSELERQNEIYAGLSTDADYEKAGSGNLATLPIKENFKKTSFTAGASIGFTLPYHSQWRFEAGYDYIAETDYKQIPFLQGGLSVSGGDIGNEVIDVSSSGVKATISTDIISAMAFYDFYKGNVKPLNQIIPYVGLGAGYAVSKTTLNLSDIYGDLSNDADLLNYGTFDTATGAIVFDNPTDKNKYPSSSNIAVIGALGLSYGIAESTFIDMNARIMYIPKVTWNLVNSDGSRHREWFTGENMVYTNFMVGLRFEF